MSLRRRLALVAAAAVAVAVALATLISYLVVRGQLRGQVDDALRGQAALVQQEGGRALGGRDLPALPPNAGGGAPYWQIVGTDGSVLASVGDVALPSGAGAHAVATGSVQEHLADVDVNGSHMRVLSFHGGAFVPGAGLEPVAIELARPLGPVDHVLAELRLVLVIVLAGGIGLAAALGRVAAKRVIKPLAEVAQTAQEIGETDDLSRRLIVHADDEVGQLAARFNWMLERLEHSRAELDESVRAQRRLVADASHELRTPVTSLRTNIEVLLLGGELSGDERDRLLADVVEQSEELSALVSDLIELARGDEPPTALDEVRLDRVVAESVARARRNAPQVAFDARLEPCVVEGVAERLARAVNNLLDNAARHSPPGGAVEVTVDRAGAVVVRDHGRGVDPEELPYVFDRFFRGQDARASPGSGLGLAIVRQVARQHAGDVTAANAPDGGAVFTLSLPAIAAGEGVPAGAGSPELRVGR